MHAHPAIIQGGMGAGVSNWRLARAVSRLGQLGVVSGVALDQIFARRLQDGDPGGHMRRGLDRFPFPGLAERIWSAYFIPGGKPAEVPYKSLKMLTKDGPRERQELLIVANFVEVFLAREGHSHPVGINYMEKLQIPHLPSLYGSMLAGVAYVLMGAGIPLKIPGTIDALIRHDPATYPLSVTGALEGDDTTLRFTPSDFMECDLPSLTRPKFLAIISSNTLAATMLKKANGAVDGFIIEGPTAAVITRRLAASWN
jgi:nitronate monooxygenase